MNPLLYAVYLVFMLVLTVISLYQWCIFIYIVLSWLFTLDFLQRHKRIFASKPYTWGAFEGFFRRIIEPALTKIRAKVPRMGNFDLSPIILILATLFVENLVVFIGRLVGVLV